MIFSNRFTLYWSASIIQFDGAAVRSVLDPLRLGKLLLQIGTDDHIRLEIALQLMSVEPDLGDGQRFLAPQSLKDIPEGPDAGVRVHLNDRGLHGGRARSGTNRMRVLG